MPPTYTLPFGLPLNPAFSLIAAVAAVLACPSETRAAVLIWDANPGAPDTQDGSGIWNNLNLTNWSNGLTNVQWRNSIPDSAVFGSASGAAGTVTLGTNISVDDITFNPAGSGNYTIEGAGNTLTLVGTVIKGTANATLNAKLAGTSGLAVTNTGTIRLAGANTYSGPTVAQGGILQVDSVGGLGNSTEIIVIGNVSNPFSTLLINVPDSMSTTFGAGKSLTLSGSSINFFGSIRGADGANNTWAGNIGLDSFGAHITGGDNGTLNITGVIMGGLPQVVFSSRTNATTVLSAVNAYRGDTQLSNNVAGSTATLKIGIDNAINSNSRLTVLPTSTAGLQVVDLNGHALTLRALDTSAATTAASSANLIVTNNSPLAATLTVAGSIFTHAFGGSLRDGVGTLALVKEGDGTQILGGANTYTGTTTVNDGTLQLGGTPEVQANRHFSGANAVLASTQYFLNGGTFLVNNLGTGNINDARLPDTTDLTFGGGAFHYQGTDTPGQNSSETIRNLHLNGGGMAEIRVSFGRVNAATFNANQITRAVAGSTALIGGDSLGRDSTSTVNVVRFFLANAPTLVGTTAPLPSGINSAAKNTRIVPFLLGESSLVAGGVGTANGTPNTFITYQAATGFRPLNPTDEFTNNAIVDGNNTRITTATTAAANAAINSLIMHGDNLTISQTLTNTSGAILFADSDSITGGTLNFGNTEPLITVNARKTGSIDSRISGTNGLTMNGLGTLELRNSNSTYSGNTTLNGGTLSPQTSSIGDPGAVASGPFGRSTVVLAGGGLRGASAPIGAPRDPVTIANSIVFQSDSSISQGGGVLTLSGPATLTGGTRTLTNNSDGISNFTIFSGSIGDGGQNFGLTINGVGSSPVVLSGANAYTGPTTVLSSTLIVSGALSGNTTTTVGDIAALASSARLGGSGRLGNVTAIGSGNPGTSGATVDPGNSSNVAGIMQTGAFSLTNGAHSNLQVGGVTAGGETTTGYDRIVASGAVTLTGGDLRLTLLGAPSFAVGDRLFLVVNNSGAGVTGTFTSLNGAAFNPFSIMFGGRQFELAYNGNFSGGGSDGVANDVVLTAVPEPGSAMVLAGALGLLGCMRQRRRR